MMDKEEEDEGLQPPYPGLQPQQQRPGSSSGEQAVNNILTRIAELVKLKKLEEALETCNQALIQFNHHEKLLEKKIKILLHQGRFDDAYKEALHWLQREPRNSTAIKELKRLKVVLDAIKDQDSEEDEPVRPPPAGAGLETERPEPPLGPPGVLPGSNISTPTTSLSPTQQLKEKAPDVTKSPKNYPGKPGLHHLELCCSFCNMTFETKSDLDAHCRSDDHKKNITSDEGHNWKYRPPPRGLSSEDYLLCQRYVDNGRCPYAANCIQAHSTAELEEWRARFKFKRQQLQMAKDKHLHGNTYPEQLMEKLLTAEYPKSVMVPNVDYAKVIVNSDLKVNMISKKCTHAWTFTITSKICILRVVLLDEAVSNYFYISSISVGPKKTQKYQNLETHCQEWKNPDITINRPGEYVYRVKVVFKTDIYGTFRQTLVFDFGSEPVLSREMHIESAPVTDTEKVQSEIRLSQQGRWRADMVNVVAYKPKTPDDPRSQELLRKYTLPEMEKFRFSEHLNHSPSKDNYRLWIHQMLYVEEYAQIDKISKFNITTSLQLVNRFLLMPGSLSAAKFAQDGELFARMKLEDDLSVDSVAGRLILRSTNLVWLAPHKNGTRPQLLPNKVYEAVIEDRGKNFIFLRLSRECVEELQLTCDQEFSVEVQFQLNRLHLCEMHHAVDALRTLDIVFPPNLNEIPTLDNWEWKEDVGSRTNENQKDAVYKVAAYSHMALPPLLIVGPFGTGKTFTLAQCAKHVLMEKNTRILICTHSNSAADLYIKEFLHPYVMEGNLDARPLRVYYRHRWIPTVSETVLQYCIQEQTGPLAGTFRKPLVEDVEKHRIIVTTLSTARLLSDLELPDDFFTHIFLDEAAQALECEMLIPLSLAGPKTRVVLAGDHMQMSPEVFSDFCRQQQFHKSILERLYDLYPDLGPHKVMLRENYRANRAIIEFTSDLFYDHRLIASKDPVAHGVYYPLTFFTARGEEVQHENSSGYYNTAEIYEVIEQVEHLQKHWPQDWGEFDDTSICVVAPYAEQVMHIRGELRKRKMYKVQVERVVNVQGKQFRVIVMSTVRTRHTISTDSGGTDKLDLGFLSNIKLLNTAITRAQSLVIAVGDPVSLCLVGRCSKVWEYYLEVCNDNDSFFGMTWPHLRSLLNNVEMTKTYILNPLAPEFIPKAVYPPGTHQGAPVYLAHTPGQPGAGGAPGWGGGAGAGPGHHPAYRGHHPQMFYGNPYMPMMYPNPYQPFPSPYPGQVLYRHPGHPGFYQAVPGGKGAPRGLQAKQQAAYRVSKVPVQSTLPVQRDDEDRSSSESPKAEPQPEKGSQPTVAISQPQPVPAATRKGQAVGYASPQAAKKAVTQKRVVAVPVQPRMPVYQPYFAYPHYMIPPDDQRFATATAIPQPPYYYQYGNLPRQPYPYLIQQPVQMQVPHRPGSGSLSPASSTESSNRAHAGSPTGSDPAAGNQSLSPGSSGNQHIQLLPNVKHVPSHLRYTTPGSGSNSRSSTPVLANSPGPTQQQQQLGGSGRVGEDRGQPVSQQPGPQPSGMAKDSPRNSAADLEFPSFRKRHHSGPRPVSQSPSYSSQSSHESSTSPVLNGSESTTATTTTNPLTSAAAAAAAAATSSEKPSIDSRQSRPKAEPPPPQSKTTDRAKRQLKLNTNTGFSRQFSDELGTPTEITNIVRMIEENIDEMDEEEEASKMADILFKREAFHQSKPSPPTGKLYLHLAQSSEESAEDSELQGYHHHHHHHGGGGVAGGRQPIPPYREGRDYDPAMLEPQTPMTPAGFQTPGTDMNTDPLEILKHLTINSDDLNKSTHGHF